MNTEAKQVDKGRNENAEYETNKKLVGSYSLTCFLSSLEARRLMSENCPDVSPSKNDTQTFYEVLQLQATMELLKYLQYANHKS